MACIPFRISVLRKDAVDSIAATNAASARLFSAKYEGLVKLMLLINSTSSYLSAHVAFSATLLVTAFL
jgi:hypothetical protein